MTIDLSRPFWSELEANHREWLTAFDEQYLRNWENILSNTPEPAMCEAAVRRFLVASRVSVAPNEDISGNSKAPDFRCKRGSSHFYVEVRSISLQQATKISGLCDEATSQTASNPTSLNDKIFEICKEKAVQCSHADAPVLLAIATAHSSAAMLSFSPPYPDMILCGKTTMTVSLNRETLKAENGVRLDSELYSAGFLKPDRGDGIESARSSISGLLLCGITLGRSPEEMWVVGLLNPSAQRPFDPQLLPSIKFGAVEVDRGTGQLRTQWPEEP